MRTELTTICYIEKENQYLMLHRTKKERDINAGKWIGVGGHMEACETPDECICREVLEETGLTLKRYRHRGILTFLFQDLTEYIFLFTADEFEGEVKECDEGELAWIPKDKLMELELWEGDRIFLKLLMEDSPYFSMKLIYDEEGRLKKYILQKN